jgi:DNA-binding MarR family transcriptional regulator
MTAPEPLSAQEQQTWHAFLQAHAALMRRLESDLTEQTGLTLGGYEVLAHVSQAPGQRLAVGELCAVANLSLSGVSRLVDKLQAEGFASRQRDDHDLRVVRVVLTDAGLERLRGAYPSHLASVRRHFVDRFDSGDLCELERMLGRLMPGSDADASRAPTR